MAILMFAMNGSTFAQEKSNLASQTEPQGRKTFIAPDAPLSNAARAPINVPPLVYAFGEEITPPETGIPHFTTYELKAHNEFNLSPGFYAEFKPHENDTLFLYDSSSDHFDEVQIHPGKEVLQGDSVAVMHDVVSTIAKYDPKGNLQLPVKQGKTNSTVIRSGFIPAQGFGSKRFRFAVRPGNFKIGKFSTVSASVHMMKNTDMGTVLCAVTRIDYENNTFYVETSNEIPFGENINWIIINVPEQ